MLTSAADAKNPAWEPPSPDLTVVHIDSTSLEVLYRQKTGGCLTISLSALLLVFTPITLLLLLVIAVGLWSRPSLGEALLPVLGGFGATFAIVVFWKILLRRLFQRISIKVDRNYLEARFTLLGRERVLRLSEDEIQYIRQFKDGGSFQEASDGTRTASSDSFPTWRLAVGTESPQVLIERAGYEVTNWLGRQLAQRIKAPYLPSHRPPD